NPSEEQVDAAERVVKYLNSHPSIGVQYSASAQVKQKGVEVLKEKGERLGEGKLFLTCFTDATWASQKKDSSSVGGYICIVGGGPVSWRSKKQTETALSSVESEYMAMFHGVKEVIWLRRLLDEIGQEQKVATPLFSDSKGALGMARNAVFHGLNKHMRIKWHWLRKEVKRGTVNPIYIKTHQQPADFLTKRLGYPMVSPGPVACRYRSLLAAAKCWFRWFPLALYLDGLHGTLRNVQGTLAVLIKSLLIPLSKNSDPRIGAGDTGGEDSRGASPGGAETGGEGTGGAETGGEGIGGAETGGADSRGAASPSGGGAVGAPAGGGAGGTTGAGGAGAASSGGAARAGGTGGAASAGGTTGGGGVASGSGGAIAQPQQSALRHLLSLPPAAAEFPVAGSTPPVLFPPSFSSPRQVLLASPLPAPCPYTEMTESQTKHREPGSCASTPGRARNVARPYAPAVPGNYLMALRPFSAP
ncbi:unnamed protein product, partial [Closterium sp. NIES-53]